MFAPETYRPTYQGPFLATGETMRRARNDAQAVGDAASVARAYYRPMRGVAAGSPMGNLRANIAADANAAQATAQSMQAYNQLVQQNAMQNLNADIFRAKEMRGLADLLRAKQEADYMMSSSKQDRDSQARIFEEQMRTEDRMRRSADEAGRRRAILGILSGLATGFGTGNPFGFAQAVKSTGDLAKAKGP